MNDIAFNGWVLGIDIGGTKGHLGLANNGELQHESIIETRASDGAAACIDRIIQEAQDLIRKADSSVLAIGIGMPGVVNQRNNRTSQTWNIPGWDEYPVFETLQRELGVPIILENDVNMAAIAELAYGQMPPDSSYVFLSVGTGVGAGIVLNGELWHGSNGAAGEIARMVVNEQGLDARFEELGQLESLISGKGLENSYERLSGLRISGAEIGRLANSRVPMVTKLLEEAAVSLSLAVANIITILDIDSVVLGGGVAVANQELWTSNVKRIVNQLCLFPPTIQVSTLGTKAGVLGAIARAYKFASKR